MNIKDRLGKEILIFDGAMGTLLQAKGLKGGEIPEEWNITHPSELTDVHKSYLAAGSDIISANTFGANRFKLEKSSYSVEQLVTEGIRLARHAIDEYVSEYNLSLDISSKNSVKKSDDYYVALDIGSLGKLLAPVGNLSFDEAVDAFKEIITAGDRAGADLILIETFTDNYEMKAAVLAAHEVSKLPVFVSMTLDENGRLLTGGTISSAVAMLEGLGVDCIGMNCGFGPKQFLNFIPELAGCCSVPILVQPNAGLPRIRDGKTCFDVSPDEFIGDVCKLIDAGACVVGGCCGTSPEYIKKEFEHCKSLTPKPITDKNLTCVSSYSHAVYFGERPLLIGERINPTGKKAFKQALRDNDINYILNEAIAEENAGVDILDVNVGLPEINECEMMERVIKEITAVSDLPLQIDTADPQTMERALRLYNGKPLLNSVNGKEENMTAVFPIAKKYGAAIVCLTLDENGIPETASERISIAEKIIKTAASYGISKKDLIFDALTMTVSTGDLNGTVTLNALQSIHEKFGVNTVLGVSNISFGLPLRSIITTTFFTLALEHGLSAGIINPLDERLMAAYDSYLILKGYDKQCLKYIEKYAEKNDPYTAAKALPAGSFAVNSAASPASSGSPVNVAGTSGSSPAIGNTASVNTGVNSPANMSSVAALLYNDCIHGLTEASGLHCREMLKFVEPLEVINTCLIPALDAVGKSFEQKKTFLPQLLMSADAAKSAFEEIKNYYAESGEKKASRGTIVIATVKGDVHDIGKNIVKILLENYDYNVIDLGKDVAPETIVEAVVQNNVKLCGLSALMTTTVVSMEETIKQLRIAAPDCRIMVGGAVLTKEYADRIGADYYSPEAMSSVRYANKILG